MSTIQLRAIRLQIWIADPSVLPPTVPTLEAGVEHGRLKTS